MNEMKKDKHLARFLMIEDDEDHAMLIKRSLMRARVVNDVIHLDDGAKAIDYLDECSGNGAEQIPDVVLLDLNLPKIQGLDVLRHIREHDDPLIRHLAVVVLSTSSSDSDRVDAYNYGVNSYLIKPFDFNDFKKMVEDLSLYWGIWNQKYPRG